MSRRDLPLSVATKTLEKAIRLIKEEAEAATLKQLSEKDGIVVLHDRERETTVVHTFLGGGMEITDRNGFRLELHRQRFEPESWRGVAHMRGYWRPGQWQVTEERTDAKGRSWVCELGAHIVDDFGTLVPVEGGAR